VTTVDELSLPVNAAQAQRWNGASGRYWIQHRERHLAEQRDLTPYLFRAAEISHRECVLDVGCGCGDTTIKAAQATIGDAGERAVTGLSRRDKPWLAAGAVGVDLSAPMLDVARQLAARSGTTNVGFVQGDAQLCPFRPNSFDVVISSFGVMFFSDPWAAFERLAAVVRPEGRLAFLCWQDDTRNEVFELPLRAFRAYMPLPDSSINELFVHPTKITELLTSRGWKDIKITPVYEKACIGSDVDDVMRYVRGMPSIRTLEANFDDQPLKTKILAEVEAEYAKREHSDGVWVNAAAWLVTARRA
jgi:ubiquinone/menaquinone biosynthesis C-methylase UbiE